MTNLDVNPYIAGSPISKSEMFYGREDVFSFIRDKLPGRHRDSPLVLFGQQRTGKTSVLYQLRNGELGPRYKCILVDVHGMVLNSMATFILGVAKEISVGLQEHGIPADLPADTEFEANYGMAFEKRFLDNIWPRLEADDHLVLMLDEIMSLDEVIQSGQLGKEVFEYIRHLMQHYERLNFIFSIGSSVTTLAEDYDFLFNGSLYHKISFLQDSAARELITQPAQDHYEVTPEAVDRIIQVTSGHPYYVQLICHCVFSRWARAREEAKKAAGTVTSDVDRVTVADVDSILPEATELGAANLGFVWKNSTPKEQAVMAAMVESMRAGNSSVSVPDVLGALRSAQLRLPEGAVSQTFGELASREVTRQTSAERYAFSVELQRLWIEEHRRLDWVKGTLGGKISSTGSGLTEIFENWVRPFAVRYRWYLSAAAVAAVGIVIFLLVGNSGGPTPWTQSLGGPIYSGTAISDGMVYVGDSNDEVYALNASTGHISWQFHTGSMIESSPVVASGRIYIGSFDHYLYSIDAETGKLDWRFHTNDVVYSSPALAGDNVVFGSVDGNVYAVDAASGKQAWAFATHASVYSSPAVIGSTVYVGSNSGYVYALDAATGGRVWAFKTGGEVYSRPVVAAGLVYFGSLNGNVYAVKATTGQEVWHQQTKGRIYSSPAVDADTVFIGSNDDAVYAFAADTGILKWSHPTGDSVYVGPAVSNQTVYVGSFDDKLYALDPTTGQQKWSYTTGNGIYSIPFVANGLVYFTSSDGQVYALSAETGRAS